MSQNAKVDTQTGLITHRETSARDVCICVVYPTIVGMSETAAKGNTTYANCVRRFFVVLMIYEVVAIIEN